MKYIGLNFRFIGEIAIKNDVMIVSTRFVTVDVLSCGIVIKNAYKIIYRMRQHKII